MKKLIWIWKHLWGKRYYIEFTDKLKNNEILIYRHKIYIGKKLNNIVFICYNVIERIDNNGSK